jgi:hypothetical protein
MNAQVQAPRRSHPLARLTRAVEGAIPNPLLAMPPLLLALGLLAVAPARMASDTWFGLAAGRDIARAGLPHSDRLTAFTAGQPWQDQQWLSHLASYGLFDLGGLPLVYLADVACLVGALCIAMLAARSLGGSPVWIAAVASPLILIQVPSAARAQTFAMPLFAALVWLLARDARSPDRRILLVLPLLALWANVHGSVLLGCALVLLRCAVGAVPALRGRKLRDLARHAGIACAALLAPFASPYGFDLVDYYRATMTNDALRSIVSEWGATSLRGWFGPLFFAFAAVAVAAILRPEIRLRLFDALCLALLVAVGLDTLRNVVWLPYAVVVLVPAGLAAWVPESGARSRLRPLLVWTAVAGVVGAGVLAGRVSSPALEEPWPEAQGAAIARAAALDPSLRVITAVGYADWLLWRFPELRGRVAYDIRFELLGTRGLEDVAAFEKGATAALDGQFAGYRLSLWDRESNPAIVRALRAQPGTRLLASDGTVYAFLRPA